MNSELYIRYLIEIEPAWVLRRRNNEPSPEERQLTEKLFKAMATAKHIESLYFHGTEYTYEEFCLFVDCLRHNESITSLKIICCQPDEDDPDRQVRITNRLLTALLSRNIGLKSLELQYNLNYEGGGLGLLLEIIRLNPDLQRLHVSGGFNDNDLAVILNQLRESCEGLLSFYIYGDFNFQGLYELADFAGQSRVLQSVKSSTSFDIEVDKFQLKEIERRLGQENTKLIEFSTWPVHKLEIIERNKQLEVAEKSNEKARKSLEAQKKRRSRVEYVHEANYDVTKFPHEMMFSVLVFSGMIGTISAFFKTCKYWRAIGNRSNFWKHLAAHVMPVVEPEVLELVEVWYAEHVLKYGAENSNFWAILLKHNYTYYSSSLAQWTTVGITDKTTTRLPFHHPEPSPYLHEQLLTVLYRRYPGLMAHTQSCEIKTINGEPSLQLCFYLGRGYMFHLVLQTFNNNKVSGLYFVGDTMKNPLQWVDKPLDFFTANSLEGALIQMKRMVEMFHITAGRWDYREISFSTAMLLKRAEDNHEKWSKGVNATIESVAERILQRFNIGGEQVEDVVQVTQLLTKQFRDQPVVINPDLHERRQKLPPWNILHTFYERDILTELGLVSNLSVDLEPVKPQLKKKSRNRSIKGTLMKGMRVMISFIVMPVLHALWPRHVHEMDQGSSGARIALIDGIHRHYYRHFKPLCGVTVDNAAPSCWPMTALVIASQIAEEVGLIMEQLIGLRLKRIVKDEVSLDKLVEGLSAYENLIPPKHVAGFQEVVKRILEFS